MGEELKRIEKEKTVKSDNELSILEKLLKKDKQIAFSMSYDMLVAGIDTVSFIYRR